MALMKFSKTSFKVISLYILKGRKTIMAMHIVYSGYRNFLQELKKLVTVFLRFC